MSIIVIGGLESVPGWERVGLGLSPVALLLLATAAGTVAGAIGAEFRLAGAIAGGLCGAGALGALHLLLSLVSAIPNVITILAILVGFLPGICVYWIAEKVFKRGSPGSLSRRW